MPDITKKDEAVATSHLKHTRRDFLKYSSSLPLLSASASTLAGNALASSQAVSHRDSTGPSYQKAHSQLGGQGDPTLKEAFEPVALSVRDDLDVATGFDSYVIAKLGDKINRQGDTFGDCCDYTAFIEGEQPDQAFLWVNHEYVDTTVLYRKNLLPQHKAKAQVDAERRLVGGSFLELRRDGKTGHYTMNQDSTLAFRIDATTPIPLVGAAGGATAIGTMSNCSGGLTPWGTILTAEENVDNHYDKNLRDYSGWADHHKLPPEHYGYIVEIDPKKREFRKLTSLGRFAHEGAFIQVAKNKKVVAYMGDDAKFQCLYKFVSRGTLSGDPAKDRDLLVDGTLYVANLAKGVWEELDPKHPKLQESDDKASFGTLRDIAIHTRAAANAVGGTPLNRPEGITVDPKSGLVIVALTNNSKAGDYHGSLLSLKEVDGDHSGTRFESQTILTGGPKSGLSCPDNVVTGPGSFLWVGMDISASAKGRGVYQAFPRNALHRIEADSVGNLYSRRFLLAPFGAEVTGPGFSSDDKTLFVSIQHPGEGSFVAFDKLTSRWPDNKGRPRSSVVGILAKSSSFS